MLCVCSVNMVLNMLAFSILNKVKNSLLPCLQSSMLLPAIRLHHLLRWVGFKAAKHMIPQHDVLPKVAVWKPVMNIVVLHLVHRRKQEQTHVVASVVQGCHYPSE